MSESAEQMVARVIRKVVAETVNTNELIECHWIASKFASEFTPLAFGHFATTRQLAKRKKFMVACGFTNLRTGETQ